jgi:hypothetical protein
MKENILPFCGGKTLLLTAVPCSTWDLPGGERQLPHLYGLFGTLVIVLYPAYAVFIQVEKTHP